MYLNLSYDEKKPLSTGVTIVRLMYAEYSCYPIDNNVESCDNNNKNLETRKTVTSCLMRRKVLMPG